MLNVDPDDLGRRRLHALERLADELGTEPSDRLELQLVEFWRERAAAEPRSARGRESETSPPATAPARTSGAGPRPPHRRRRTGALAAIAVLGVGVGVLVAALGDDDSGGGDAPATTTEARTRATDRTAPPRRRAPLVRLRPLAGATGVSATARLVGDRLELRLRLPATDGHYAAWLYNSIADARAIGRFPGGERSVRARLSADPRRYRFLDVSREPPDDNPNHSGGSVLRVPVASLAR